jgi:hypothetical protein
MADLWKTLDELDAKGIDRRRGEIDRRRLGKTPMALGDLRTL